MTPRILTALLLLVLAGDSPAPIDPELEAVSWSLRPRGEIVDALAERLGGFKADGWYRPVPDVPVLPSRPPRMPADFKPGKVEVADRLASWVPADTAVVFFGSKKEAEEAVEGLAKLIPEWFPVLCADLPGRGRDALRRAVAMLLLPTIWRSNPEVRTGTRQVALVISDPDVRWAPDIALLCEVDDASLVRAHRQATFSWEERGNRRMRVDGLDATSDDGSIRSYFALEGGVAVWSTTRSLRERILATGSGESASLVASGAKEYAFARQSFPTGVLLVIPDAFLDRVGSTESRVRRSAMLRCEATRRVIDELERPGNNVSHGGTLRTECPCGGRFGPGQGDAGSACSIHGPTERPLPLGDVPTARPSEADRTAFAALLAKPDALMAGGIPVAGSWDGRRLHFTVSHVEQGEATHRLLDSACGKRTLRGGNGNGLIKVPGTISIGDAGPR